MSLAAIEKRLNSIEGRGAQVEYVWSRVADGVKTVFSGNPDSQARCVIEIQIHDHDGPGAAPRIIIDGREVQYG